MAPNFANKTILVVEDEQGLREPLAENFESLGCSVLQAKNGAEALHIVQQRQVDAIISDIRMPGGDGLELLRALQNQQPGCPAAMLMTGYAEYRQEDAYQLGAEYILDKPFDLDRLESAVSRLLTPVSDRWISPEPAARPTVAFVRRYRSLTQAALTGDVGIGRGGLFVRLDERLPAKGKPVAFDLRFDEGQPGSLAGQGVVRWSRPLGKDGSAAAYGIEFDVLAQSVRDDIVRLCGAHRIKAFIPNAAGLGPPAAHGQRPPQPAVLGT